MVMNHTLYVYSGNLSHGYIVSRVQMDICTIFNLAGELLGSSIVNSRQLQAESY